MSPKPPRQRPGGPSALVPQVQPLAVGGPDAGGPAGDAPAVDLVRIALNPLNKRDMRANPDATAQLAKSLLEYGQMKACTVVTHTAFVAIFPELAEDVGAVDYVHVDGARRRAAAQQAGVSTLTISVNDDLARTRTRFIGATVAENLDREDLNPVEEAEQIAVLVAEVGTQAAAAEQLRRTPAWVTQRLNLLRLVPELQDALRGGKVSVRDVRNLHRDSTDEQLAALQQLLRAAAAKAERERREDEGQPDATPKPPPRLSRIARAVHDLGDTPDRRADSLLAELPVDDVRALVEVLLRRLDG